jgi:hypothetical protein
VPRPRAEDVSDRTADEQGQLHPSTLARRPVAQLG